MNAPKVRLGDLGRMIRGSGIRRNETVPEGLPCIRYGEIYTSYNVVLDRPRSFVPPSLYEKCPHIKKGDLVLALTGENKEEIAKSLAYFGEEEVAAGGDTAVWTGHGCDPLYLAYMMYSPRMIRAKADASNGHIVVHASVKKLQQIEVSLPPLSEQRKIAASVDKAMKRVDAIERQFEKLRETAAACFKAELDVLFRRELFAGKWPMHMLREHVDVLAGYAFKGDSFSNAGIKICGGLIIMPDRIKWEECKHWRDAKGFETFLLAENDIVVALDRPWISSGFKVGKIEMKDLPCLLIQRTARLRARNVDPDFLLLLLRDKSFREHCSTSGTTVPHISHKDIETFPIPIPPMARQKEVVAKIAEDKARCDGISALAARGLANCARMRKAILAEAFAV